MAWEATVGKWYDDENYEAKETLWQRMLDLSAQHGDVRGLREILSWFSRKNMHGDYYKTRLIGCFLYTAGVDLGKYVDESILSDIVEMAEKGNTMYACAINLLKKENAPEEFIDEFKIQFEEKN